MSAKYRNKPFPKNATIGDLYDPCIEITDDDEAKRYFGRLVEHNMKVSGKTREEAAKIELDNIGYYSGYFDKETSLRVRKMFSAKHPIFGDSYPSPLEAFNAGRKFAEQDLKNER